MPNGTPLPNNAPPPVKTLEQVRREIDAIDDAIHDLLVRRTALGAAVRAAKGPGAPAIYRPGREAAILMRLLARDQGALPPGVVVRVWREVISANTRSQGPLGLAVYAPAGERRWLDLARDHFGAAGEMRAVGLVSQAVGAVGERRAALAVLPLDGGEEAWWRLCGGTGPRALTILARLPFLDPGEGPYAAVVGRQPFDPSGRDRGFVLVEAGREMSRSGIKSLLAESGLDVRAVHGEAQEQDGRSARRWLYFVETERYAGAEDPRLDPGPRAREAGVRLRSLGGYADAGGAPAEAGADHSRS